MVSLRASGEAVATFVAPPAELNQPRLASTQFNVTYNSFAAEAQAAFQYAVDIWSAQLTSPVPIRVQAYWDSLGSGVLGMAGPNYRVRDFAGAPVSATWYPAALANKAAGHDLYPGEDDIVAYFSSDFASLWYFGTGATPPGKINFTSVVLHELGHGLGFTGLMLVAHDWGGLEGGNPYPTIYDRFPVDSAGRSLLNTAIYPNPSVALGTVAKRCPPVRRTGGDCGGGRCCAAPLRAESVGTRIELCAPGRGNLRGRECEFPDDARVGQRRVDLRAGTDRPGDPGRSRLGHVGPTRYRGAAHPDGREYPAQPGGGNCGTGRRAVWHWRWRHPHPAASRRADLHRLDGGRSLPGLGQPAEHHNGHEP
jgi:hypothetical protein